MSKKVLFKIYDLPISENTLYEVERKKDTQAPEGFIREGTSKVLSNEVADSYPTAAWDSDRNVWDTGLTETSAALKNAVSDPTERKRILNILQEKVVKPLEDDLGEGILDHSPSNNFWDGFRAQIFIEQTFNTAEPRDLLNLYLQVLHRRLTPKVNESHPAFKHTSQFCIENKGEKVDRKTAKKIQEIRANALFHNLVEGGDKQALETVFQWLNLGSTKSIDNNTLYMQFDIFLGNDREDQNKDNFIKAVEDYSDNEAKAEVMLIHMNLKKLENTKHLIKRRSEYWLKLKDGKSEEFLGSNLKVAAEKIANNKELEKEFALLVKN